MADCYSCGRTLDDCEKAQLESSGDLAVLLILKEHGYKDSIDRVISQWRGHALPTCDPLAID